MLYEPDYATWCRHGFQPTTPLIRKRLRRDGYLDVLFLQTNGCYSAWVSELRSIWLVVRDITTWDQLQDEDDLRILIKRFPTEAISLPTPLSHAA